MERLASATRWADRAVVVAIISLIVLSPLGPMLGNEQSLWFVEVIVFVACTDVGGQAAHFELDSSAGAGRRILETGVSARGLFLFFCLQIVPLHPQILRFVSPATYHLVYCQSARMA